MKKAINNILLDNSIKIHNHQIVNMGEISVKRNLIPIYDLPIYRDDEDDLPMDDCGITYSQFNKVLESHMLNPVNYVEGISEIRDIEFKLILSHYKFKKIISLFKRSKKLPILIKRGDRTIEAFGFIREIETSDGFDMNVYYHSEKESCVKLVFTPDYFKIL